MFRGMLHVLQNNGVFRINSNYEMKRKYDSPEEMEKAIEAGKAMDGEYYWVEEQDGERYLLVLEYTKDGEHTIFRFSMDDIELIKEVLNWE